MDAEIQIFVLLTLCSVLFLPMPGNCKIVNSFTATLHDGKLQHLVVDSVSGKVYVGAINRLYQLTETLQLEVAVITGPHNDNPFCPPPVSECHCVGSNCKDFEKSPIDSFNKALLIDSRSERLISCSNLFQGHCTKHLLGNISLTDPPVWSMIVPNDETSSIAIFVAPGPPNPASTNVLYVASTRSSNGLPAYRDIVPAICMRNLHDLDLVSDDILTPSRMDIEVQQRDLFRVHYVYGFSSMGFSYFLTVQRVSAITDSEKYVTQIVRICQNNKSLYSYTEIPLECHHRGVHYNILRSAHVTYPGSNLAKELGLPHIAPLSDLEHILVAVFSNQTQTPYASDHSAMCVYSLRDIRQKFTETLQKCFHGIGNTGPDHFIQPKPCFKTPFEIEDDYCGQYDINHPMKGNDPILKEAVLVWNNTNVTAITAIVVGDHTVAFVGTEDGFIKKAVIESASSAREYGAIPVQLGARIGQDLAFDRRRNHLFVLTSRAVRQIRVHDCGQFMTCADCLGANDPFCGWCPAQRRCSIEKQCPGVNASIVWLAYDLGHCAKLVKIAPRHVQKQSAATSMVILTVQNLQPSTGYQCTFSGYGMSRSTPVISVENLESSTEAVKCETPIPNLLPPFPTGKDHIQVRLSITADGYDLLSTNFTFFDCNAHTSCTKCTNSEYPCVWCVQRHLCTSNIAECQSDVLITSNQVKNLSRHLGPNSCPRVENFNNSSEILVASDTELIVKVLAVNLQNFQTTFKCIFNVNGGIEKNAWLLPEVVENNNKEHNSGRISEINCDPVMFYYTGSAHYINVPFSIVWGNVVKRTLDNPNNVQVRVFKCSRMATTCGRCRSVGHLYDCGWCTGSKSCSIRSQCVDGSWLRRNQTCPDPIIKTIYPESGPLVGGTILTIEGENFGLGANDTIITIDDIPCSITESYQSVRLTCQTGGFSKSYSSIVLVTVGSTFVAKSTQKFLYVDPILLGFQPDKGPASGGTFITISGRHLNTGSRVIVALTNGTLSTACNVVSRSHDSLVCITNAVGRSFTAETLSVVVDNSVHNVTNYTFIYTPDPVIISVIPGKGISSGGTLLTVQGSWLDSIASPTIIMYVDGKNITSPCVVYSSDLMKCRTPAIPAASLHVAPSFDEPLDLDYGFLLDNVPSFRIFSGHKYSLFPDPEFEEFDGLIRRFFSPKHEYLTINGKHLNAALSANDIQVKIGEMDCDVTLLSSTQLTCRPTENYTDISTTAKVMVYVGSNMSFYIGDLHYDVPLSFFLTVPFTIGIVVGAFLLVCIIFLVCLAYRHKSKESYRVMKRMQNQMDVLEARVAKECKEAFAELQTDMTVLTSNISGLNGIPFRNYSSYCVHVLFPGIPDNDHPVLGSADYGTTLRDVAVERGLRLFNQLISNKIFLLLFIRTLENHNDFIIREKVNVASLLSVALQDHLEYQTDILKTLLADLIEQSMLSDQHPKLLLRRTESVAEKMLTNWFTFLLHRFLKERAGEPLYLLCRAIKHQVERGPIDALSGEAKYSLSEEKLIRQQIDYHVLTIQVLDDDDQYNQIIHTVKVLDCDTISQVKDKILDTIYKYVPFTLRPDKDDLDLEWQTGVSGCIILQDEDMTNKRDGEYHQLNTLGHYNVADGAVMSLVARQRSIYSATSNGCNNRTMTVVSHKYDTLFASSLPLSRSLSPYAVCVTSLSKPKYYHLVNSSDQDHSTDDRSNNKMVSEIYLTRLLATKGTLQQFIDNVFATIFSTAASDCVLPLAIKYIFDFLDSQAIRHGILDPEVIHTWKSNSLPLRFWVNVIKNFDSVFDIQKSSAVDSCMSVIAQTFMDSCSITEHKLGKDSPSSKLLFAKDIPKYKKWVERYYEDIQSMPPVSDQDMNLMLSEESMLHQNEFHINAALYELYQYTVKYHDNLMLNLEEDELARNYCLAMRLNQVYTAMHGRDGI